MVSVIVPNYNYARFLEERMRSVFGQEYQDFELILLDDASTDDSVRKLEAWARRKEGSRLIVNPVNGKSPFRQWEKGMALAGGEYLWIAESDDTCTPELLARAVKALEADPESVLWFCASDRIDEDGHSLGIHPNQAGMASFSMDGKRFIRKYMRNGNSVVNASSVVFRREAALRVDNGWNRLEGYGDYLFWIGLAAQGNVLYDAAPMNRFRFHTSNTTAGMVSSARGLKETIVTDDFLLKQGYISKFRHFRRSVNTLYRIRYREIPQDERERLLERLSPGPLCRFATRIKRVLRRMRKKD